MELESWAEDAIRYHAVSSRVNNVRNQGRELINPIPNLFG